MGMKHSWYDTHRGWDETNPGWYEKEIYIAEPSETITRYFEILEWMYEKLDK